MPRPTTPVMLVLAVTLLLGVSASSPAAPQETPPTTGPATEQRFPPLTLPAGFKATLFACDPLVEYPSVIAIGPQPGTLFVAHDYLTGLGVEIIRRDEIRLLRDTDHDGYADKSQLYADGFNSIQGLAHHDGSVFVMHAPLLTALRDTDGDGVADERRDLLDGLGLPPEENSNRLHCANGVVVGHDGWLYLALGDRGCDVQRVEGDRLVFRAGGILRCRTDGRDLHVLATGMRNIYDIALDEELNVFVRDNENDGGDFMIRVCHSFHGADHGYPYLYRERPDEAMRPLADLGRGSSAGGTSYLETAFAEEYRQSLFFCEWGRAVVRYRQRRSGGTFQPMQETDFAAGAPTDPYGFKPTDLVVDHDGSLLVSDWCDGQRPQRGRGRIYRITATDAPQPPAAPVITANTGHAQLIALLNSPSHHQRHAAQDAIEQRVRDEGPRGEELLQLLLRSLQDLSTNPVGRLHAVWIIAHVGGESSLLNLLNAAQHDADPRVRAQAVRAVADLADPVLVQNQLAAGRGDRQIAQVIAGLAGEAETDPRILLEVLVTLGRLRWADAPRWLAETWQGGGPAQAHAAMLLLRRSDNWPAVLKLLDQPDPPRAAVPALRTLVLQGLGDQSDATIVDGIIQRLDAEPDPVRRGQYVDLLARVHRRPAPWVYWGFRPAPRPANPVDWERTGQIARALDLALADPDHTVRGIARQRMEREGIEVRFAALAEWLMSEKNAGHVAAILQSLRAHPVEKTRLLLWDVVASAEQNERNRITALELFERGLAGEAENRLIDLAEKVEDGPVLAAVLETIGKHPQLAGNQLLLNKLASQDAAVRAAALRALSGRMVSEARPRVVALLSDTDPRVRREAAAVAGTWKIRDAVPALLKTAASDDPLLCRASLESLRQLGEPGAVSAAVAALQRSETQLAALEYLRDYGTVDQLEAVAKVAVSIRASEVLTAVAGVLSRWLEDRQLDGDARQRLHQALAKIHGDSGTAIAWSIVGPLENTDAEAIVRRWTQAEAGSADGVDVPPWRPVIADGVDFVVTLKAATDGNRANAWVATTELDSARAVQAQFLASADGVFEIWLNGRSVFARQQEGPFLANGQRFEAPLTAGTNRLLVKLASDTPTPRLHVRFRPRSSKLEHERLIQLLLESRGNAQRGREVFLNADKSLCIKCHRIGEEGGRIGPDLTGIGSRFSRIHLIESILEPSRTIAPSYTSTLVILDSGKMRTGVTVAETPETITLGDKDGNSHTILRSEIEQMHVDKLSVMPEGLERRMTERELADLIAYLISQQKNAQ